MRIHVFTPLPPLSTDIANHSQSVLAAMAERCEVVAWTTQTDAICEGLTPSQIRTYEPLDLPLRELNAADAVFYNFGNHAGFHRPILHASMAVPGVVILHDLNMQHFFARFALSQSTEAAYLAIMRRHHGEDAAKAAQRFIDHEIGIEPLVGQYPLTLAAADRAIAVVGHNRSGMQALCDQTSLPVFWLPLSTRFLLSATSCSGRSAPPYKLIAFGFIGPNRRLASLLLALSAMPEPGLFSLDIYGTVEASVGIELLIESMDLAGCVTVHGFVPAEVLTAALDASDLAINLRYPTMGEASGSQLRIWAHGLPSIVTRVGWYADLPEDAVAFVDPDDEVASIVRHLLAFQRDPAPYRAAGQRGRALVERDHSPGAYADGLLAIAASTAVQHRRRGAIDLAGTVSRTLADLYAAGGRSLDGTVLRAAHRRYPRPAPGRQPYVSDARVEPDEPDCQTQPRTERYYDVRPDRTAAEPVQAGEQQSKAGCRTQHERQCAQADPGAARSQQLRVTAAQTISTAQQAIAACEPGQAEKARRRCGRMLWGCIRLEQPRRTQPGDEQWQCYAIRKSEVLPVDPGQHQQAPSQAAGEPKPKQTVRGQGRPSGNGGRGQFRWPDGRREWPPRMLYIDRAAELR